jgi:hypothetical protein
MKRRLPLGLILVATCQFIAPLILPPAAFRGIGPALWGLIVLLFALLGFNLLRGRAWSRVATIFLQGFNILVRILVGVSHAIQGGKAGGPLDAWLISTFALSAILSVIILYYVDLPDVQVLMQ